MKKRLNFKHVLVVMMTLVLLASLTACGTVSTTTPSLSKDRAGNAIKLPKKIERVVVAGPADTEILAGLGVANKIVAADTYSKDVSGLKKDVQYFDMYKPDAEKIIGYKPDIVIVSSMPGSTATGPFQAVKDAGICVVDVPASDNFEDIEKDIQFIADVMGVPTKGEQVVSNMKQEISSIQKIGSTIKNKKTVYFEIAPAPQMYSFGTGTFLNEMLDTIGAKNILADQKGWVSVSNEAVLHANPDVILTNVNYTPDPIGEITSRQGWKVLNAVKNNQVFSIDTNASSRPSQNIVKALKEMAKAIYPDQFK